MSTSRRYDALVVGAGHNGLVAAAILAGAGKSVLVLEQREQAGGLASNDELAPGFTTSIGPELGCLLSDAFVKELGLELTLLPIDPAVTVIEAGEPRLTLWRDQHRRVESIRRLSAKDAESYPKFRKLIGELSVFLRPLVTEPAPVPEIRSGRDLLDLLKLGWGFRKLGARPMHELMRVLPMSVADFLGEWFESDALKAALAAPGLYGVAFGPRAAGTAANFLYHQLAGTKEELLPRRLVRGGLGAFSRALVELIERKGGEVRTGCRAERILCEGGRASGVTVEGGAELRAGAVLSNLSPRTTFLELVDPTLLEPGLIEQVRAIRYRGVTAKLDLALSKLPRFSAGGSDGEELLRGVIQVGGSIDDLDRAHDAAKYGRVSERPFLQVLVPSLADPSLAPDGRQVMSITMQCAPYRSDDGEGSRQTDVITETILTTLAETFPDIEEVILHRRLRTPRDYERELGLPEGSLHQGEMALDQLFFMRPVPGWARHETPIEGLYLSGAATHPGGGIIGASGRNAASKVLENL